MQKVQVVNAVANRYFVSETTSGSTSNVYLTDGVHTLMLEDCLIWDSEAFEDEEFYDILQHVQQQEYGTGVEEYEGWHLIN
jgi:hypothetical protein